MTNYTPDYTRRVRLKYLVNNNKTVVTLRARDDLTPSQVDSMISVFNTSIYQLHHLTGIEPSDRRSKVDFVGADIAERGSKIFYPLDTAQATIVSPYGTIQVRDLLNLISVTGLSQGGSRFTTYYYGIAMNLGVDFPGGIYGDLILSPSELSSVGVWIDNNWGPNGSLRPFVVGPDNTPLAFVRRRILVRFSAKRMNRLRK